MVKMSSGVTVDGKIIKDQPIVWVPFNCMYCNELIRTPKQYHEHFEAVRGSMQKWCKKRRRKPDWRIA